jgi:hypothetical protein
MREGTTPHHDRAFVVANATQLSARGTRLLLAQFLRLLLGRGFQATGNQAPRRGHGHFFHLVQIDIETGSVVAKTTPHHNFAPVFGQFADAVQFFLCELPSHDLAILEVR